MSGRLLVQAFVVIVIVIAQGLTTQHVYIYIHIFHNIILYSKESTHEHKK